LSGTSYVLVATRLIICGHHDPGILGRDVKVRQETKINPTNIDMTETATKGIHTLMEDSTPCTPDSSQETMYDTVRVFT